MAERKLRGGARPGAGRKPLDGGRVTLVVSITREDAAAIERWKAANNCRSTSEAVRQMIRDADFLVLDSGG